MPGRSSGLASVEPSRPASSGTVVVEFDGKRIIAYRPYSYGDSTGFSPGFPFNGEYDVANHAGANVRRRC